MPSDAAARAGRRSPLGWFANLPVVHKLAAAFTVICLLLLMVGGVAVYTLHRTQAQVEAMYRDSLQAISHLRTVSVAFERSRYALTDLAVTPDRAGMSAIEKQMVQRDDELDAGWAAYTATDMRGRETARDAFAEHLTRWRQIREQLVPLARASRLADFVALRNTSQRPHALAAARALDELAKIEDQAAAAAMNITHAHEQRAQRLVAGLAGLALLLSAAMAAGIGRMIGRPLQRTVTVLQGLADGRLDQRLPVDTSDEIGRMGAAFNTALDSLTDAMSTISGNAAELAASSEELAGLADQMTGTARQSAEQAHHVADSSRRIQADITSVAGASEQMNTSVREIARTAAQAATVADRAAGMSQTTQATLASLGASSVEISNVVNLITTIAQQTNLLALNATIEAARAGDAGKGFAVVASEVKDLAQATEQATTDISSRVNAIQVAGHAATTALEEIITVIEEINAAQRTIAAAVEQQTRTSAEIGKSITAVAGNSTGISDNIKNVAHHSAETGMGAGTVAHAAGQLTDLAVSLQQTAARFRFSASTAPADTGHPATAPTPTRAVARPDSTTPRNTTAEFELF
ncbi:methyl-accepting chemotaxis protein [Actinoplanes sp. URMC 104]|uniref:methyl-accepting chemotaxis protein n=1 Tax=Actinoplanes sp. URMC 104 TaxID=3423409 RepID=UPI003F1CCB53